MLLSGHLLTLRKELKISQSMLKYVLEMHNCQYWNSQSLSASVSFCLFAIIVHLCNLWTTENQSKLLKCLYIINPKDIIAIFLLFDRWRRNDNDLFTWLFFWCDRPKKWGRGQIEGEYIKINHVAQRNACRVNEEMKERVLFRLIGNDSSVKLNAFDLGDIGFRWL